MTFGRLLLMTIVCTIIVVPTDYLYYQVLGWKPLFSFFETRLGSMLGGLWTGFILMYFLNPHIPASWTDQENTILSVLNKNDSMFGLEIVESAPDILGRGSIYVRLSSLEAAGLVASDWEQFPYPSPGRIHRRIYRITDEGRKRVKN